MLSMAPFFQYLDKDFRPMSRSVFLIAVLVGSIVVLGGCGRSQEAQESEALKGKAARVEALKSRLTASLSDPLSAQFRNLSLSFDDQFLCGEINGKNRFGGYVGFRRFAVSDNAEYIEDNDLVILQRHLNKSADTDNPLMAAIRHCFKPSENP